jgi:hypothetical protein
MLQVRRSSGAHPSRSFLLLGALAWAGACARGSGAPTDSADVGGAGGGGGRSQGGAGGGREGAPAPALDAEPPTQGGTDARGSDQRPPGGEGSGPDGPAPALDVGAPAASTEIVFDPPGGTFTGTQAVKLTVGAPDAVVHFTTDGSLPTRASPVYRAPLMLAETALVRAFAATGAGDGAMAAAAFVRVAEDAAAFTSNLPIVVLHTHRSGVLPVVRDGPKLPGSMSLFEPEAGGRARLLGPAALTSRAGLRIRGGSSLRFPQKSYGVELYHPGSDEDDDRRLLGWPSGSDFALIGASRADRSLMRNALAFTLSNEIGRYAPRVRFVEVYLVESGGALARKDYLGVFTLAEKIKQDKARVAVTKLEAGDLAAPAITGGYVVRIDEHETHFLAGGLSFNFVHPTWERINVPARQPQRAYLQGYLQEFLDAVARPDFKHPRTGKLYSEYIDVAGFIDHNLLNALFKNVDGLRYSAYFYKDRGGPLVAGPLWDFDRSSGTRFDDEYGQRAAEPREWSRGDGTHPLKWNFWGRLYADPVFKAAYAKRWQELTRGAFAVEHIHALVDRFAAELREAQARHFARWPELPPTGGSHDGEIKILKDWFAARVPWMSGELQ